MMLEEFRYILSELNVGQHTTWGAFVELIDFEHRDYIEDVFIEIFDVEYSFSTNEDVSGKYILYFEENASYERVNRVVEQINEYHKKYDKEFDLPSST
jgi:hypothetical protein